NLLAQGIAVLIEDRGAFSAACDGGQRFLAFIAVAPGGVGGEKYDQKDARADPREEQLTERNLRRHGIEQHGYRWRQENTERPSSGDNPRSKAGRIAASAHCGNTR